MNGKILISFPVDVTSNIEQKICKDTLLLRSQKICLEINGLPVQGILKTCTYSTTPDQSAIVDFNFILENQLQIQETAEIASE